jgi:hypothetical protein
MKKKRELNTRTFGAAFNSNRDKIKYTLVEEKIYLKKSISAWICVVYGRR